jgi:hypothetical protein
MGLIDLKTDLKSLKYGKDRLGGGDSGQPYIQTSIDGLDIVARANEDGLIRGGRIAANKSSDIDSVRIGKFFNSSKGKLFITKQVGLQYSNPRLETRRINIGGNNRGILGFINTVANAVSKNLGPTRIYNLGINTLAQIPQNAYGTHFNRHGLTPIQDDQTKYLAVAQFNNEGNQDIKSNPTNRLASLQKKFQLGVKSSNIDFNNGTQQLISRLSTGIQQVGTFVGGLIGGRRGAQISNIATRINRVVSLFNNNNDLIIDDYIGGPGSTYGIGKTIIRRYDITENGAKIDLLIKQTNDKARLAKTDIRRALSSNGPSSLNRNQGTLNVLTNSVENKNAISGLNGQSPALKNYQSIINAVKKLAEEKKYKTPNYKNYLPEDKINNPIFKSIDTSIDRSPIGLNPLAEKFKYYGDGQISDNNDIIKYDNSNVYSRTDSDILTVIFRAIDPFEEVPQNDANRRHAFSAYMKGFKDDFNAGWNDVNYAGRAESFYIYNDFKRSVSFNLQIPCFNKVELFEKYRNLGQLAATTAGAYNNGFLGGVLLQINLGNYLVGEFGILNSLSYSIPDDASWDTTPEGRLAMLIEASFNFTIIHKKLPQYETNGGFFEYLPNVVNNFLPSKNRDKETQNRITAGFAIDNYSSGSFNVDEFTYLSKRNTLSPISNSSIINPRPNIGLQLPPNLLSR